MKRLIYIALIFLVIGCSENKEQRGQQTQEENIIGFACEPDLSGFLILIKYDGKYVSTYDDSPHLRPEGWVLSKLQSESFQYHFSMKDPDYPATQWNIPKGRWDLWASKLHLHEVGVEYTSPDEYITKLYTIEEWKAGDYEVFEYSEDTTSKYLHICSLADIGKLDDFVEERMRNPFPENR